MLNKVVLIGRLTKDPELRKTQGNIPFVNFTVAVNRPVSEHPSGGCPQQDDRQTADFINCIAWRRQAETLAKYMRKGSMIAVDGRLAARDYMDKDNVRRFVTEVVVDQVVFLESKLSESRESRCFRPRHACPTARRKTITTNLPNKKTTMIFRLLKTIYHSNEKENLPCHTNKNPIPITVAIKKADIAATRASAAGNVASSPTTK
ncbi:MAG: single-stranded DNA-binding protein [Bacillus subtilis]|nr:single-stranded DNA-binding protein [Bacillus subtilis]